MPIIISLVDDLRAIQSDTVDPVHADPARLGADDSRLQADIGTAQGLPSAPDQAVQTAWSAALGRLLLADRTLHAASVNLDPAAIALAHQQFATAGDDLLGIGEGISAGG